MFLDREEAGAVLAKMLAERTWERPVVLAIPRGGVAVARPIAEALQAPLGIVVARKIGAPHRPELAIGATTAAGDAVVDARVAEHVGADRAYLQAEAARQAAEARRREVVFDGRRVPDVAGRDVIVVDDGLATGLTALAAARSVRRRGARRVVLAIPVASPESAARIAGEVDEIVCPIRDPAFRAVGCYYRDFEQIEDAQVRAILDAHDRLPTSSEP